MRHERLRRCVSTRAVPPGAYLAVRPKELGMDAEMLAMRLETTADSRLDRTARVLELLRLLDLPQALLQILDIVVLQPAEFTRFDPGLDKGLIAGQYLPGITAE